MARKKLSGIPFVDRFRARRAISKAKKEIKKIGKVIDRTRKVIEDAKKKADVTDRVSIVNDASAVEDQLEKTLCPIKPGGSGGDPCDEVRNDCRKKVGANTRGPVAKSFRQAWEGCVTKEGCDPND